MKKLFIANLFIALCAFLIGAAPVQAADLIEAKFENTPLFSELNLLPGDTTKRWATVKNISGEALGIYIDAKNIRDPKLLGDRLQMSIRQGEVLYYEGTMSGFFGAVPIKLVNLAPDQIVQFDFEVYFEVYFEHEAGNIYQGQSLNFDINFRAGQPFSNGSNSGSDLGISSGGSIFGRQSSRSVPEPEPRTTVLGEEGAPLLSISKTSDITLANPGMDNIRYEVTVRNDGALDAFAVTLSDNLPGHMVFAGTRDEWREILIGDLAPGQSQTRTFTAAISPDAPAGTYTNTAWASASNHDPVSASAAIEVQAVKVAGVELIPSGFSVKEALLLVIILSALILAVYRLRRRLGRLANRP